MYGQNIDGKNLPLELTRSKANTKAIAFCCRKLRGLQRAFIGIFLNIFWHWAIIFSQSPKIVFWTNCVFPLTSCKRKCTANGRIFLKWLMTQNFIIRIKMSSVQLPLTDMKNRNLFSGEIIYHVFSYFHPIDSNNFIIIINISWCNRQIIKILNSAFPNFVMCYRLFN